MHTLLLFLMWHFGIGLAGYLVHMLVIKPRTSLPSAPWALEAFACVCLWWVVFIMVIAKGVKK